MLKNEIIDGGSAAARYVVMATSVLWFGVKLAK